MPLRRSVRLRTTALAVAVVGLGLLAGAVGLVVGLRSVMLADVHGSLLLHAADAVRMVNSGGDPTAAVAGDDDILVQISDAHGLVIAATPNVAGRPRFTETTAPQRIQVGDDAFLVMSTPADDGRLVLIGHSLDSLDDSTGAASVFLAFGVPVLMMIVGMTTWQLVGHALAPVEAIRAEVDVISSAQLHRRVPEPTTDDEIGRLAATMNRMLDRLERANDRQRQFIADASHELRSPITTLRQHAEVALAHPDSAADLAATAHAEALRLQALVDDLLLLARVDENMLALRRRPVDLDEVVRAEAARHHDDVRAVEPVQIEADLEAIRRALHNIGDNATRHARHRVRWLLTQVDGWAVLHVDDDGHGVPQDERERVFERFVRLDASRSRTDGGSGLGLAIVAEVIAAHGGTVEIGESPLGGARVTVRLPVLRDSG